MAWQLQAGQPESEMTEGKEINYQGQGRLRVEAEPQFVILSPPWLLSTVLTFFMST